MADGSNLKAKIGMDTGDFEKGAKKVTKAAQDMGKEIGSSLGDVGRALGIDTGLVGDLAKNIENATTLFKGMGAAGGQAASSLTRAMTTLRGAIAGLGLTAAIIAFKELNAQAANFEQRLQGVNLAASANAYRNAYAQTLYDASGAGNFWANFKEKSKTYFAENFAEIGTLFTTNASDRAAAKSNAERAAQLASDMVELRKKERDLGIEIQGINNKIAEAQNKFRDTAASATERKQAEATITELINEKYGKQAALQSAMLANVRERNSLTTSTEAELDEQANLERGLLALQGQQQQELNSMLRTHNSINKAVSTTKQTVQETVSLLEQVVGSSMAETLNQAIGNEITRNDVGVQRIFDEGFLDMMKNVPALQGEAIRLKVPVVPEVDIEQAQKAVVQLTSVFESGIAGISEAIGGLIGDLINGEDAWQGFAQAGISVVADMLATVGKAFIAEGVGVIAAQAALVTGGGAGAIAAGAAMVALAATMKSAMSNAAANWSGGGYSTSVASSAYTSNTGLSTYGREMNVKVTGTLVANGSQLVAVLNNENNRTNLTT